MSTARFDPAQGDAEPLARLLGSPMPLRAFLEAAIRIAAALAERHDRGGLHGRLTPQRILLDPARGPVTFASGLEPQGEGAPALADASLWPYLAPEATGRMNRPVDARADLYALGAIFYEMLAGAPPFVAEDLLGYIHAHVARTPALLCARVASVPVPVSDIVARLLAKMAEERYQSARGLLADLRRCLAALAENGQIHPFTLGERDVPERFQPPSRLYGRDAESAELLRAFYEVLATGKPAVVLASGPSGIGKSSLVRELERPVVRERGAFAAGKFEAQRSEVPHGPLARALGQVARQWLTESEVRLSALRERLREALGPNARLATDLVPALGIILGPQPDVPPLGPQEAHLRFQKVFQDLVGVLARREHPLVLFLDDMQWADPGSLLLLKAALLGPQPRCLLLVGAFRETAVDPRGSPVAALLEFAREGIPIHRVAPTPLGEDDVRELIADTFRCGAEQAAPLAALLHGRTAGNPFFVTQVLAALCQDGLIALDTARGAWRWDLPAIAARETGSDVLALLAERLSSLPAPVQRLLSLGACLGVSFDIGALCVAAEVDEDEARAGLVEAARTGLVELLEAGARFVHERVWQAAYALVPASARPKAHLAIGRRLAAREGADLFEAAGQLERGAALIDDPDERIFVARIHLEALRKAMHAAGFRAGAQHAAAGRAMLPAGAWTSHPELAYALFVEGAECEAACGGFAEANRLLDEALGHARERARRAKIYRIRMDVRTHRGDFEGTCREAVAGFAELGIALALHPSPEEVHAACREALELLGDRPIEALLDLPEVVDPEIRAALSLGAATCAAAYFLDENLGDLVACRMATLSLVHGNTDASTMGYAGLGAMLGPVYGRYAEGQRFGKLAHDLATRRGHALFFARTCNIYGHMTSFWTEPYRLGIELGREGARAALQAGDPTYASFNVIQLVGFAIQAGEPLGAVAREIERQLSFARENQLAMAIPFLIAVRAMVGCLLGRTRELSTYDADDFEQAAFERDILENPLSVLTYWYLVHKTIARVIAGRHEEALAAADHARSLRNVGRGHVILPAFELFTALTLAALHDTSPAERRPEMLSRLRMHEVRLGVWAQSGPVNFAAKHALVLGEIARLGGRETEAMRLYDRAIDLARKSKLAPDEAIACETAARFYESRGHRIIQRAYLREARAAYARWGAIGKVLELERAGITDEPPPPPSLPTSTLPPPPAPHEDEEAKVDAPLVARVLQALSREIRTEGLSTALLRVLIEHAGAQRSALLLLQGSELVLSASATSTPGGIEISQKNPSLPPTERDLPLSVVGYVRRTREPLILEDAYETNPFATDPHVLEARTRAVLCVPITRSSVLLGVLYLENNLARGAFTARRLPLLELLAAQAAISLENAALYEDVARERRRAEEALRDKLALIEEQEEAIRKLSTPIIEVWEGIVTMPLFGAIDEKRAGRMMEVLLEAVTQKQCAHAILDVTGVGAVDAVTAEHLVRLVRAVRLLGAKGIVAGMQPEVARTIVSLGVDLTGIETRANLREALLTCMRETTRR